MSDVSSGETLVDRIRRAVQHRPEAVALRWLPGGGGEERTWTIGEFDADARGVAGRLQTEGLGGRRVAVVASAGCSAAVAIVGCLYAGAVPVPLPAPRRQRPMDLLRSIAARSSLSAVLSSAAMTSERREEFDRLRHDHGCGAIVLEECDAADRHRGVSASGGEVAYIQYTSGSTVSPKGVAVTHANIAANCGAIGSALLDTASEQVCVSWLPLFHDMGLVGGLFTALHWGYPLVLMPPEAFVMRPRSWLDAISRFRATVSVAPNFAYDLCVRRIPVETRATLDLSTWRTAFNGSERIDAASVERFAEAFAVAGFRADSMRPCYGLAEATLLVTVAPRRSPRVERLAARDLEAGRFISGTDGPSVVSCGAATEHTSLCIVDPVTLAPCEAGVIGEIWVAGPGVAAGYHDDAAATAETFGQRIAGRSEAFLRTGDLGFLSHGELFVTGRCKDVIIIDGRNIHPEDIEGIAEASLPGDASAVCVAFGVPAGPREAAVVVVGVPPAVTPAERDEWERAIRLTVAERRDLALSAVVFVERRKVPFTSSGKRQRGVCRLRFLAGTLGSRFDGGE